jgi:GNAT superfamily N-acetyltransferase
MIRYINENDENQWKLLWEEYLQYYSYKISDDDLNEAWSKMNKDSLKGIGYFDGDDMIGFIHFTELSNFWSSKKYCQVLDVHVKSGFEGNGVGSLLYEYIFSYAELNGFSHVSWITSIYFDREQNLYDRIAKRSGIQYKKTF